MTIKTADAADIYRIAKIEQLCFSDPWSLEGFVQELGKPMNIFLAASEGENDTAGYIIGSFDGESAYIENIAVSPDRVRRGIGTALLRAFEAALPPEAVSVVLDVRESNTAARRLYEKNGFKVIGVRRNFYEKPRENAEVMEKKLAAGDITVK